MSRWRIRLVSLYKKVASDVEAMGEYLDYEGSCSSAIKALVQVKNEIDRVLEEHKVKVVR